MSLPVFQIKAIRENVANKLALQRILIELHKPRRVSSRIKKQESDFLTWKIKKPPSLNQDAFQTILVNSRYDLSESQLYTLVTSVIGALPMFEEYYNIDSPFTSDFNPISDGLDNLDLPTWPSVSPPKEVNLPLWKSIPVQNYTPILVPFSDTIQFDKAELVADKKSDVFKVSIYLNNYINDFIYNTREDGTKLFAEFPKETLVLRPNDMYFIFKPNKPTAKSVTHLGFLLAAQMTDAKGITWNLNSVNTRKEFQDWSKGQASLENLAANGMISAEMNDPPFLQKIIFMMHKDFAGAIQELGILKESPNLVVFQQFFWRKISGLFVCTTKTPKTEAILKRLEGLGYITIKE